MSSSEEAAWKPPTEAEQKILAARRERADKISRLMGDYLLRGHKMLATTCAECATIELQDREGKVHCVACAEVDCAETAKDDPVINPDRTINTPAIVNIANNASIASSSASSDALNAVEDKLRKATLTLSSIPDSDVESCIAYVKLIRECAEAIKRLQEIN